MQATDLLRDEHRTIERVLDALERAVDRLDRQGTVRPGFFLDAVTFIVGFADGCHHQKEEGALFPAMVESGMPPDDGPIEVMLEEHEAGRRFAREIRDAAGALDRADPAGRRRLIAAARGYVALLREHIQKEDQVLFAMADALLSPGRQDALLDAFGRLDAALGEERAPDRLRGLAEALRKEAAGFA